MPRIALDPESLAKQAGKTLAGFPHLAARLPATRLLRAASAATTAAPAPLLYWLYTASNTDFAGAERARACVANLEAAITLFEHSHPWLVGAWKERLAKLLPPQRPGRDGGFEHFTDFRATLFELHLALQLVHHDAVVTLEPDGGPPSCDFTISWKNTAVAAIEAYAPQKGAARWYAENFAGPWEVLTGRRTAERGRAQPVDTSMDASALATALSNMLTTSNFEKQKYRQLDSGTLPTILAVRGYQLTDRLEDLMLGPATPAELAGQISEQAWAALPERCQGLLLCLTEDIIGTAPPNRFIPHPNRTPHENLNAYLAAVGVML